MFHTLSNTLKDLMKPKVVAEWQELDNVGRIFTSIEFACDQEPG